MLTHWKRPWCWEGLGEGREGDNRGWDGWMAWLTRWMWVWVNSGSCWWTGSPGVLRFMGSQRVGHDWATELNWTGLITLYFSDPSSFFMKNEFLLNNKPSVSILLTLGLLNFISFSSRLEPLPQNTFVRGLTQLKASSICLFQLSCRAGSNYSCF